jgi:hypothetical protein
MYLPWWAIILGVIIVVKLASSGKEALRGQIEDLESRIEELEEGTGNKQFGGDDFDDFSDSDS